MSNDELLYALAGKLLADPRLVVVSPSDIDIFGLLRALRDAMVASDSAGKRWLTCLLAVTASRAIEGEFEFADAHSRSITPENYIARSREIASWGAK